MIKFEELQNPYDSIFCYTRVQIIIEYTNNQDSGLRWLCAQICISIHDKILIIKHLYEQGFIDKDTQQYYIKKLIKKLKKDINK